ncbi:hypothetical protein G6L26_009765 [Agrobacterium radiobacter]|uniref:hypothetical protein n=1 Tax=Agrobacterium tumefaciens complex TaxID=1183400 RepID=UPI00080FC5CC|nr:hypothetical protein [Agrobacterium tumefaciens]NTA05472.1 hypothetical protein [Agrobacterium tumefaciens]NTA92065.1 hypothetical protein [Agrobacterium tumefaciens]OCJ32220.1 hypothetical protein A6U90_09910 [Agrobacterium tumefaciens]
MESADKLIDLADKQGVHVATIVLVLFLVGSAIMLWRKVSELQTKIEAQRDEFDEDMVAERTRHAIEIAAERKLNAELQETRLLETRSAMEAIQKVTVTIQNATDAVNTTLAIVQRNLK